MRTRMAWVLEAEGQTSLCSAVTIGWVGAANEERRKSNRVLDYFVASFVE